MGVRLGLPPCLPRSQTDSRVILAEPQSSQRKSKSSLLFFSAFSAPLRESILPPTPLRARSPVGLAQPPGARDGRARATAGALARRARAPDRHRRTAVSRRHGLQPRSDARRRAV